MSTITAKDGTQIYYKDWGVGRPVVLSHGWPLNADSWEAQMFHLASNGYRVARISSSTRPKQLVDVTVTMDGVKPPAVVGIDRRW